MSRNTASLVVVVVLAMVATSCSVFGGSETTTTTSTTVPPTTTSTVAQTTTTTEALPQHPYGGEAVIADRQEPPTLNAFAPGGNQLIVSLIGQGYASGVQDVDGTTLLLVPELVTELPTVANGGVVINEDGTMTVDLTIRDEAVWEDGEPISGADFQFTLDTIMNPDYPITRTTYENIFTTEVGDKTFSYTLAAPTVQYETLFNEVIPKHAVEGTDFMADWNDTRWPSNGPFKFDGWVKGESLTLVRNDAYWKIDEETEQQLPYLDSVTWRFIPDPADELEAFKAKEVDIVNPDSETKDINALKALEARGARVEVLPGQYWEHVNFQFGPGRLDRNPNSCNDQYDMRLAVAQTIDKAAITAEILGGHVDPLSSYVEAYSPALSHANWDQYPVDHTAASGNYTKAVAASGVECSVVFTTASSSPDRVRLSELLVGMFAESGIPYENDLEDSQLFFGDTLSDARWDMSEWSWQSSPGLFSLVRIHDVMDPGGALPVGSNYYDWGTETSSVIDESTVRFKEVRDAMNATVDDRELVSLIAEAEALVADNLVILPLYARRVTAAVWADEIGNFVHNPTSAGYPWNIEFWFRADQDVS
jgi:peptide/nickel transport system substrate-binding protein